MTTNHKGLPTILNTATPDVPRDLNALASAVDLLFARAEYLPDGTDLNTVTTGGLYCILNATNAPYAPSPSSAFLVRVETLADSGKWSVAWQQAIDVHRYENVLWHRHLHAAAAQPMTWRAIGGAAGRVTVPVAAATSGTAVVTFPHSRFSTAPNVAVQAVGTTVWQAVIPSAVPSAVGMTVGVIAPTAGTANVQVDWIARNA